MTEFQKKRLEKLIKGEANFLCGVIGIKEECEIDTVHDLMAKFAEEVLLIPTELSNAETVPMFIHPLPDYGNLYTLKEFQEYCKGGGFIDYDGIGHPVVMWFNK